MRARYKAAMRWLKKAGSDFILSLECPTEDVFVMAVAVNYAITHRSHDALFIREQILSQGIRDVSWCLRSMKI